MILFQKEKTGIVVDKIINKNKLENTHKQNKSLISMYCARHMPQGVVSLNGRRLVWMSKFHYVCPQLRKKSCEDAN